MHNMCRNTFNSLEKAIDNAGYSRSHPVFDIAGEYILAKKFRDANLYFFRHHFDLGKSTFGQSQLTEGDLFLSETQKQSKENQEDFHKLFPQKDSLRILGWHYLLGKVEPEKQKLVPNRISKLWDKEKQEVKRLRKLTEQEATPRQARLKYQEKYDNSPQILEEWSNQFDEEVLNSNVIFACSKRIEMLQQRVFGKAMGKVMIDEGIETGKIDKEFGKLADSLSQIGVSKPHRPRKGGEYLPLLKPQQDSEKIRDIQEARKQFVGFDPYKPESDRLSEKDFDHLQALARKVLIHLYQEASEQDTMFYRGITDYPIATGGETQDVYPKKLMTEFVKIWKNIAKVGGQHSKLRTEKHKLMEEEKLDKLKKLERMEKVFDNLFASRNCRLRFKRNEDGEIESLKMEKPLMYYLWDFIDQTHTETDVWILDATTDKEYYDILFSKYRFYSLFEKGNQIPEWDINPAYIGEGNSYGEIEVPDMSYGSLEVEELQPDYEWYLWDWNVKGEKDTKEVVSMNSLRIGQTSRLNKIGKVLKEAIDRQAEKKDVGVVTYKFLADKFEKAEARNFSTARGTNALKDVDILYVIGKPMPHPVGMLENYLQQYRELPDYHPLDEGHPVEDNNRMLKISEKGGMVGFRDRQEVIENHISEIVDTETFWENYWKRMIEYPVFDSYFRLRGQLPNLKADTSDCKIIRLGYNARGFLNEPDGTVGDLLGDIVADDDIIRNWGDVPKGFFGEKEYVTDRWKLKSWAKAWKQLRQDYKPEEIADMDWKDGIEELDTTKSTWYRWKKNWESIFPNNSYDG